MPGGAEGIELLDGAAKAELTVDLDELRGRLTESLRQNGNVSFYYEPNNLSAAWPKVELTGLALVAFVQDHATKQVIDAVQVSVP